IGGGMAYTEGSYHLQVLLRKLEAFDQLIAKGKMPLAALVANDINNTIAHFDPKIYFPKLFSRFALLFALHIGELASFEEAKGSVAWKALGELYKVDLDAFAEFDLEGISFDAAMSSGGTDQGDEEEDIESSSDSQDHNDENQSEW
ncbi:MAG TPA: type VI secretion system protein IglI family protein, partial [Desulfatiglandales bacterium]|nr:type VI secretion system protein IglI family protein [Desulfatiglandales bacterium]